MADFALAINMTCGLISLRYAALGFRIRDRAVIAASTVSVAINIGWSAVRWIESFGL